MPSKAIVKHLKAAKADITIGTASFRSAANHIAAAVKAGATQQQAADAVGKSQPWVNRLLKWRGGGFKEAGPFTNDHATQLLAANNPDARRFINVGITHTKRTIVAPYYTSVPTEEFPRLVTVYSSPDAAEEELPPSKPLPPSLRPDAVEAEPPVLVELAEKYERLNSDLFMNMQQHGGIAAGSALQVRFKAVAAKLLCIIEQSTLD